MAGLYNFGFSVMLKDVVLFFLAERRGRYLSGRHCFCSWISVMWPGVWAVWLLFSLVSRFFFFLSFDDSFLRLRCAGVLSLEGFKSVFYGIAIDWGLLFCFMFSFFS